MILLLAFFAQLSLTADKTDFEIKIIQSPLLTVDTFTIDNTSIKVTSRDPMGTIKKHQQTLTKNQVAKIKEQLKRIDLAQLNADYTNHGFPDDDYEFDFYFDSGQQSKAVHIYGEKVNELLELTTVLNSILPVGLHVRYDERYLKQ